MPVFDLGTGKPVSIVPAIAKRRKLGRKRRRWPGKIAHKRNWRLHEYEEWFVLKTLVERQQVEEARLHMYQVVVGWCRDEPGRWDGAYLTKTLKRLRRQGLLASYNEHARYQLLRKRAA